MNDVQKVEEKNEEVSRNIAEYAAAIHAIWEELQNKNAKEETEDRDRHK